VALYEGGPVERAQRLVSGWEIKPQEITVQLTDRGGQVKAAPLHKTGPKTKMFCGGFVNWGLRGGKSFRDLWPRFCFFQMSSSSGHLLSEASRTLEPEASQLIVYINRETHFPVLV
jgi:hypothetical protein